MRKDIMGLFSRKNKTGSQHTYDPSREVPVLRCSICTGETVFGFKDRTTGHFSEVSLVRGERDLQLLKDQYHIDEIAKEY